MWQSETAPKPGLVVEVDLDRELQVVCMQAVAESQLLKEQAEAAALLSPAHKSRKHTGLFGVLLKFLWSGNGGSSGSHGRRNDE